MLIAPHNAIYYPLNVKVLGTEVNDTTIFVPNAIDRDLLRKTLTDNNISWTPTQFMSLTTIMLPIDKFEDEVIPLLKEQLMICTFERVESQKVFFEALNRVPTKNSRVENS